MNDMTYDWKRFWCPREGKINLSDDGFLYIPEPDLGPSFMKDVVSFDYIADKPCLILLGEPGIGKTNAINSELKLRRNDQEKLHTSFLSVDLNQFSSDVRLSNSIFDNSIFKSWLEGGDTLYLFLDSLDECLLRIDSVANLLAAEFSNLPVERLSLRIACRTADWPDNLENKLIKLWGTDNVGVYELAPLRKIDVAVAANANEIDSNSFIQEIQERGSVPFAIKPITLKLLINMFRKFGQLPATQKEIYLKGCKLMCEETSESRRSSKSTGTLSALSRFEVASRIAAVTVFSHKYAIWTGLDYADFEDEDVKIAELIGDKEDFEGEEIDVNELAINETLSTGLFSSRGRNRIGFSHKTYAEFLAAHYLLKNNLSLKQKMGLLSHPGDPFGKLVRQTRETAAWLATIDEEVFEEIMTIEPEVLLLSDVGSKDIDDKKRLVDAILGGKKLNKQIDLPFGSFNVFSKLNYPKIGDQLLPYLRENSTDPETKSIAMDIAGACNIDGIENELLNIALDGNQSLDNRIDATNAIKSKGSMDTILKLKPLLLLSADQDPYDELKGLTLIALWPKHISMNELFKNITPPKRKNTYGMYQVFLSNMFQEKSDQIPVNDLEVPLKWVETQEPRHELPFVFARLIDDILTFAWNNLEHRNLVTAFAKALLSRLNKYDEITRRGRNSPYWDTSGAGLTRRKLVLDAILLLISDPDKEALSLSAYGIQLFANDDLPWLIEKIISEKNEKNCKILAELIRSAYNMDNAEHLSLVYYASKENVFLADSFDWLLNAVELDSPVGQSLRNMYIRRKRNQEKALLEPPPEERISQCLDDFESGNVDAWWRLNREMTLDNTSTHFGDELQSDLTALPGWKISDSKTKNRILTAAKEYLLEQDPKIETWLGTSTFDRPAFAGYRALVLLQKEDPLFIEAIERSIWSKWAPVIIAYPAQHWDEASDIHTILIGMAYENAPHETIQCIFKIIEKEVSKYDTIFILHECKHILDNRLAKALLKKANEYRSNPKAHEIFLTHLLKHASEGAREYAQSLIPKKLPSKGISRDNAIKAAVQLILHTDDAGWEVVWPVIKRYPKFGEIVVTHVAETVDFERINLWSKFSEDDLSDLFIWLEKKFPRVEDPDIDGVHMVSSRENVGMWRDSLLTHLEGRGSEKSVIAIRKISSKFPSYNWLNRLLFRTEIKVRETSWRPIDPRDLIKLAHDNRARFVNNGEDLINVIQESLIRLEKRLQGETPQAMFLWNEVKTNLWRPKTENDVSDYIKSYFEDDLAGRGIIVNREVEIRRPSTTGIGNRTDIHVNAVTTNSDISDLDPLKVIIEVKGCWHQKLDKAMKEQLQGRYMKESRTNYGIYLIGWFSSKKWDKNDSRIGKVPAIDINEAIKKFDNQALELSEETGNYIRAFVLDIVL